MTETKELLTFMIATQVTSAEVVQVTAQCKTLMKQ